MTELSSRRVPISEAMRLATEHHQAGKAAQAEAIYRAILESEPTHFAARYNLALLALQAGRGNEAVPVLRQAVQLEPDREAHWLNLAAALAGGGDPGAARDALVQARHRGLESTEVAKALGQVERMLQSARPALNVSDGASPGFAAPELASLVNLFREGRFAEVEGPATSLCQRFPQSAAAAELLGATLLELNKYDQARQVLAQASSVVSNAAIERLYGIALRRLGRSAEAREAFERGLAWSPDNLSILFNASANAISDGDPAAARRYAERALALRPGDAGALRVIADAAAAGGAHDEAVAYYERAIALVPDDADLHINLGGSLYALGRRAEAAEVLQRALALRPADVQAHQNLAAAYYRLGDIAAARVHHRAASDLSPDRADLHTAYLFCLLHDVTVTPEENFREHRRIGELIEAPFRSRWRQHDNDRDRQRDLRIGFVSADLRDHAVAYLIEPIWRAMRRARDHVIAYVNQDNEDDVSARLRLLTDDWVHVERLDDDALDARIRADRIDILFDLSGHTTGNRLPVFARRPAPVQVSWLGYPGTTGLTSIDYRFLRRADDGNDALDGLFTEKLVRFGSRTFEPDARAPAVNPLPALTRGVLTFASFNRPAKLSEATIDLWSRVLRALPESRMLIVGVDEEPTRNLLEASFLRNGIAIERLAFRARVPISDYLAMHHEVDVVLDSLPYAGGTTTHHALWMGVPVLTLSGLTVQQSQGAGILGHLGMSDWAPGSEDEYVEKARRASADLAELDRLRQGLRPAIATAFRDADKALDIELQRALRTMWQRWCAGDPPAAFTVSA
jgi:protein O-GlcNAc transferase